MRKKTTKRQDKQIVKYPAFTAFEEMELNPRPAVLAANRVSVYSSAESVTFRFFWAAYNPPTALHPDRPMLELNNVAEVMLSPTVAKALVTDLTRGLAVIESRMGEIESVDEKNDRWNRAGIAQTDRTIN